MANFAIKGNLVPSEQFANEGIHYKSLPMEDLDIIFDTLSLKATELTTDKSEGLLLWFFQNAVVNEDGEKFENMQTLEDIRKQELFVVQEMMNEFMFLVIPMDKKKF